MLKIAHIAPDEKFIDIAVEIFESAYPKQNTFFITSAAPWKLIKDNTIYHSLNKKEWLQLFLMKRDQLKSYDLIILHSLPTMLLVPMAFLKQRYVWLGWGYDYYERAFDEALIPEKLILAKTALHTSVLLDSANTERSSLFKLIQGVVKKIFNSKCLYRLAMRNLVVFSPVLPKEFDLVKNRYGLGMNTKYYSWNYGFLEKHLIKNIELENVEFASAILLGNSATPTNNHIEALDIILSSHSERHIYIPLSYGNPRYAEVIKNYINCSNKLTSQCKVLDKFMPMHEYSSIINRCGYVIMNHVRQQALGNIIATMYRGAKIFLREESIIYGFFKDHGAVIYSVQELEKKPSLLDKHLAKEDIIKNRKVIEAIWSEKIMIDKTRALVAGAMNRRC